MKKKLGLYPLTGQRAANFWPTLWATYPHGIGSLDSPFRLLVRYNSTFSRISCLSGSTMQNVKTFCCWEGWVTLSQNFRGNGYPEECSLVDRKHFAISSSEDCIMSLAVVLTQCRRVTGGRTLDRQTDGRTEIAVAIYSACNVSIVASCKNVNDTVR